MVRWMCRMQSCSPSTGRQRVRGFSWSFSSFCDEREQTATPPIRSPPSVLALLSYAALVPVISSSACRQAEIDEKHRRHEKVEEGHSVRQIFMTRTDRSNASSAVLERRREGHRSREKARKTSALCREGREKSASSLTAVATGDAGAPSQPVGSAVVSDKLSTRTEMLQRGMQMKKPSLPPSFPRSSSPTPSSLSKHLLAASTTLP